MAIFDERLRQVRVDLAVMEESYRALAWERTDAVEDAKEARRELAEIRRQLSDAHARIAELERQRSIA